MRSEGAQITLFHVMNFMISPVQIDQTIDFLHGPDSS